MASHLIQLYDAIRDNALTPSQENLGIRYIDFADYYRVGPELGDRIARMGPQDALNAVIVAPLAPEETPADAAKRTRQVTQPFDIFYIYRREHDNVQVDLRDVIEKWADPLHDLLCTEKMRRLNNLSLTDGSGHRTGYVVGFDVSLPNVDVADNDALYPIGLACFAIRVEVYYVVATQYANLIDSRR